MLSLDIYYVYINKRITIITYHRVTSKVDKKENTESEGAVAMIVYNIGDFLQ